MKLSYVIIMCDKDYQNVFNIVKNIEKTSIYDHEIFVMDNRLKKKNIKISFNNAKLIDMGGNKYQFNAKRKAVLEYCTGDYVWFIDCDDNVIDCPNVEDTKNEIVCFNYNLSVDIDKLNADIRYNFENNEQLTGENHTLYTLDNYLKIGVPNWAKLFRLDIAKQFYQLVQELDLHLAEDCLILLYMLYNSTNISIQTKRCYEYHIGLKSDTGNQLYTSLEPIERMFTGSRKSGEIVDLFVPKDIQNETTLSREMVDNTTFSVFKEYFFKVENSLKMKYVESIGKKYFNEQELTNLIEEINEALTN